MELTLMAVEAVIFDLDGTLAHFNLDYKALHAEVRGLLMSVGVPASVLHINESIFEMLNKSEICLKHGGKSDEAFEEIRRRVMVTAEKYEMEAAETTSLLSGAVETLKELKKMKIKIGLCTTSSERAANYILQRFKIDEYFDVTVPRNKVKHVKPSTEQFELALNTLGVKAKDTVIVGDGTVDMLSTKEVKAIAVGLTTGISTREQLMLHGANYIITSLSDLPVLIKEINKAD
jgi:HAD superfamily hydrolase (TIGR01549 family)